MNNYRVRRPKENEELLNLLRDKGIGVFGTFKSALVFAAAIGFKEKKRKAFSESSEPIAYTLFSEHHDRPFMFCLALAEYDDVSYLREEKFPDVMAVFEEYAAGGLDFLEGMDKSHLKEDIERYLLDKNGNLLSDLANDW